MDVKLIITYDPAHTPSCKENVVNIMKTVDATPVFLKSKYDGIFLIDVAKPKEVVKKIRKLCDKNKDIFGRTHRYIPVDKWVSSKLTDMQSAVKSLVPKIGKNEKWKMELDKRYYHKMSYGDLIIKLTDVVDREKIDLKRPEKIIKVEVIGSNAAISVLNPDEQLVVS
ncbi:MAG: THUMP domain-containing protein [Actinobacteria bacterium]|nr:THUMP domain-containing protein [Actinomycetota bacterium]